MQKGKNLILKLKNLKNKKIWIISLVVVLFVAFLIFKPTDDFKDAITEKIEYKDLKETVLATGQVVSNTDLSLSFNSAGTVKSVRVKVGDEVKAGQILATIDQTQELALLKTAQASLISAKARYKKILEGATNEEIAISEVGLENAKRDYENVKITQNTLVNNAYNNLLNSTIEVVPEDKESDYRDPVISGNYNLGKEGKIFLETYPSTGGISFRTKGLIESTGLVNASNPQPIGNSGLYIKFQSSSYVSITDWVIEIPNKNSPTYLLNYNAYELAKNTRDQALSQAKSVVDLREAELALRKASARSSDIELAEAEILSAEGQLGQAQARYNNTLITAPVDGSITRVELKVGELAQIQREAIVLQDVSNMYIEANVNEANIASLEVGLPVDITFDAFGLDKIFKGYITKINPSSNLISGVVNYKITSSVESTEDLRSGMTANMTINIKEKNNILIVPKRALITEKDGTNYLRVIDPKTKKVEEKSVVTGFEGDGGMIEIISGIEEGAEIIILIKK